MNALQLKISIASVALFSLLLISCKEEDELPALTMEGKNTLGCLVDGKVWLPTAKFNRGGIFSELQTSVDTIGINIYADNINDKDGLTIIFYDSPSLRTNKLYDLVSPEFYVEYSKGENQKNCFYDKIVSGHVILTMFDINKRIITGTFEFVVYGDLCSETVTINKGRFDLSFNR